MDPQDYEYKIPEQLSSDHDEFINLEVVEIRRQLDDIDHQQQPGPTPDDENTLIILCLTLITQII